MKIKIYLALFLGILKVLSATAQPDDQYTDTLLKNGVLYGLQGEILHSNLKAAIRVNERYQVIDKNGRMFFIDEAGNKTNEYTFRSNRMSVDDIIDPLPYDVLLLPKTEDREKACWIKFIYVSGWEEQRKLKEEKMKSDEYQMMLNRYDLYELKYNPINNSKAYEKYRFKIYDIPERYEDMKFTSNLQEYIFTGDFKKFSEYWIIARLDGKYGIVDIRNPESPVLPFMYDNITGITKYYYHHLLLERNGLKCYYPISSEPQYKQLEPFTYNFARFVMPDGHEGWLRLDGKEYFDTTAHAQYMPADIIAKADSVLIAAVGQRIFDRYYERSTTIWYDYMPKKKSTKKESGFLSQLGTGISDEPTKGHFAGADVSYHFRLSEEQFTVSSISEYVSFDSAFNLSAPLDLAYIPQYVWDNDTCNFITSLQAVALAAPHFSQPAVAYNAEPIAYPTNENGIRLYRYCWAVSRIIPQTSDDDEQPYGDKEMVLIDAITGEVLATQREEFGSVPIME